MNISNKYLFLILAILSPSSVESSGDCGYGGTMTCERIDDTVDVSRNPADQGVPVLDGDTSEWAAVTGGISPSIKSIFGKTYEDGKPSYKCLYDSRKVYFSLEIPGKYRFDTADNKKCAAIGTMMPIGDKAAFLNMGGCPESLEAGGCPDGIIPDACADYAVDLGAHWELKTTDMNTEYPMNATTGSGNDLVANNDDEWAVSPYCRPDDNDAKAGNEWSGAWSHTNPVEGEMGIYKFEISRTLKTPSITSDAQMEPGQTYDFGIAYWDPFETEMGWTAAGHFLTGCSADWIKLRLSDGTESVEESEDEESEDDVEESADESTESGAFASNIYGMIATLFVLMAAAV
mmetsp:Transcript_2002/g.4284  ORF Transcript_2002/g.4284 Transcript_2002/m.4284 type:complete len:346 (-) Transcript_2002:263-1300(-)